jgi:hypothetical protein
MLKLDVLMVLLDPGLNRTASLSNVYPLTLTGNAVYTQCFQAKVILKETGDFPKQEAYRSDVLFGKYPADPYEGGCNRGVYLLY